MVTIARFFILEIVQAVPSFRNEGVGCGLLPRNDGGRLLNGYGKFPEGENRPELKKDRRVSESVF